MAYDDWKLDNDIMLESNKDADERMMLDACKAACPGDVDEQSFAGGGIGLLVDFELDPDRAAEEFAYQLAATLHALIVTEHVQLTTKVRDALLNILANGKRS